jgi:hypothetical protein
MADCDVLTESAVKTIQKFQDEGGLIVGDAEVCPAIKPDFIIPRFARSKQASRDRTHLHDAAKNLRQWLDSRYSRTVDSSNPDVVTRLRKFGTTDYVFAVNDRRDYGTYVGGYALVMEDGLPSETTIHLKRESGFVYDLLQGRELSREADGNALQFPVALGPCEGRVLMVTERPIREVTIAAPQEVRRGESIGLDIAVTDAAQGVDAVIPIDVRIVDPEGRKAEFSGYYGAKAGRQSITLDIAPNDRTGVWTINVKELASGKSAAAYVRVRAADQGPVNH